MLRLATIAIAIMTGAGSAQANGTSYCVFNDQLPGCARGWVSDTASRAPAVRFGRDRDTSIEIRQAPIAATPSAVESTRRVPAGRTHGQATLSGPLPAGPGPLAPERRDANQPDAEEPRGALAESFEVLGVKTRN